jgi:TPP-dependent pyruvate/acetoin dehydrogenase alpha subunit
MTEQIVETEGITYPHETVQRMYYFMRLTRALEERLVTLFRQTRVIGGLYRSLGQEGESVATAMALDFSRGDVVSPLIRNLGSVLVAGFKPVDVLRQYMAKGDSLTRGRDLNIHWCDMNRGFLGPISMLGDMIPVMAGVTLAGRMQKKNMVGMVHIGDGGSSTGAFAEGVNFASVQRLPLVIVVEDNGFAYSTPTSRQTAAATLADKAFAYGSFGETVDGNDVFATHEAAQRAVERARAGEGVTILEVKTFRMKGHAEHDNQAYVPPQLLEQWKQKDPVERFEREVAAAGVMTPEDFSRVQAEIKRELDAAVDEAERSPMPRGEDAALGVYAGDGFWER